MVINCLLIIILLKLTFVAKIRYSIKQDKMEKNLDQKQTQEYNINNLLTKDYSYILPPERIPKYPVEKRDQSNLLIYKNKLIKKDKFENLGQYLDPNCCLVFNNTTVIQARIFFYKETGAKIEIFCIEPYKPRNYELAFKQKEKCTWKCIIGNLKKWKENTISTSFIHKGKRYVLTAEILNHNRSFQKVQFRWNNKNLSFGEVLEITGITPIPPYLNRETEASDKERYQTSYSQNKGSVAAHTAGLHFTFNLLNKLDGIKIELIPITLHIGTGTFKPINSEKIINHEMHKEHFFVSRKSIKNIIENINNIVTVGTTSLRTLESIYWTGVKILENIINKESSFNISQWEAYELNQDVPVLTALNAVLEFMENNQLNIINGSTQMMIVPGYEFRLVKGLITNFHLPKSTLLLLISAFIGEDWKRVYHFALENNFRFLSYGDSSLLYR